ncbi:hypothetical protein H5410_002841 [Solanum commersonii]|uniref:Uncharacterized protein n=1 Tax=Solanum commersonii TaxID=4109 RepID=A0A9J6B3A5_SOLCO|nr:hypothetical protein H5410_002841 [Solanum commersonii]
MAKLNLLLVLLPLLTSNAFFCRREECEQQHDYFISRVKELTNIFKEMTYNIDVHTSKKISQPLKDLFFNHYLLLNHISYPPSVVLIELSSSTPKGKEKEKEKDKGKAKEKEKEKEKEKNKEKKVVSCDVKQQ